MTSSWITYPCIIYISHTGLQYLLLPIVHADLVLTRNHIWNCKFMVPLIARHGAHLGPTGPRWAPCWPHELFYLGRYHRTCNSWVVSTTTLLSILRYASDSQLRFFTDITIRCSKLDYGATILTHLPLVLYICVGDWVSIGSDNGLSPIRRQVIVRTNAGLLYYQIIDDAVLPGGLI